MDVRINLVEKGFTPNAATEGAGAFDVYGREISYNREKGFLEVKLGFSVEVPEGFVMKLYPRSSVSNRGMMLANSVGIIDSDYRGEVAARFYPNPSSMMAMNPSITHSDVIKYCENVFRKGEACAQVRIEKNEQVSFIETEEALTKTKRGEGGFGSTDKK